MTQLTNYAENKILDFMRGQALSLPAAWHWGLASAASDAAATELAGTGYARQPLARSLANYAGTLGPGSILASSGGSHTSSNNVDVSWGNPAGAWGTGNYVVLYDDPTAGNAWFWFPIDAIVIGIGSPNPVAILAGTLEFSLGLTGGMSDYLANKLIDLLFRAQAFTYPATTYGCLYSTALGLDGTGTEFSASGYARVAIASSLGAWSGTQAAGSTSASSGTAGRISNNAAATYPVVGADWGVALAHGLRDAATVGNLLWGKLLTASKSVLTGGPRPSFAANTLGITLD